MVMYRAGEIQMSCTQGSHEVLLPRYGVNLVDTDTSPIDIAISSISCATNLYLVVSWTTSDKLKCEPPTIAALLLNIESPRHRSTRIASGISVLAGDLEASDCLFFISALR